MPAAASSTSALAPSAVDLGQQLIGLLARPPRVQGIALDTTYFDGSAGVATRDGAGRVLLPNGYSWSSSDGGTGSKVPLQLCEYLAYKAALAYEPKTRIEKFLEESCRGTSNFAFFDSSLVPEDKAGVAADAQGYGFIFERRAYVIFRGTAGSKDWKINRIDALTSSLDGSQDRRHRKLQATYGRLLGKLGDPNPGRHVGFCIAWAALKDQVEDWLAVALENGWIDQIVYSGHSLGGAMAQIAAFDHARIEANYEKDRGIKPKMIGAVVTFGAPAVGSPKFVEEYGVLLGDRTVLLESSGDLVPRIMQRWYYRMLYPLRQRVRAGIQAHLQDNGDFAKVVSPWSFASEPPLSNRDIDLAIANIRAGLERELRKVAEKAESRQKDEENKRRENRAAKAGPAGDNAAQSSAGKPSNDTKVASGNDAANGSGEATASTAGEKAPSVVYWVVAGVVVIAIAGVAWYFVRRKLFSHDIEQRYALYLSTLSYQQLRAKHAGDVGLANKELAEHLLFVRGELKESSDSDEENSPIFESVKNLPLPIAIRQDPEFVKYLESSETFV